MLISAILFYSFIYTVYLHKYHIERKDKHSGDIIHLLTEGSPNSFCLIKIFTKTELSYHYENVNCGNGNICEVPCRGFYNIHTPSIAPYYILQISSKESEEYIKVAHTISTVPLAHYSVDKYNVEFTTTYACNTNPICTIKSGHIFVEEFHLDSSIMCNSDISLKAPFVIYDKPLELYCGPHYPKFYFFETKTMVGQHRLLERYPFRIKANAVANKIDIFFDEPILDSVCKFEIKKKDDAVFTNKCGVTADGACFQICTATTMEFQFTADTDKDFVVKITTRNSEGVTRNMKIDKNELSIEPITSNTATVKVTGIREGDATCVLVLKYQKYPKLIVANPCGENQPQACPNTCTADIPLYRLIPDTKYIALVTYTENGNSYTAERMFKTSALPAFTPQFTIYPETVIIRPEPAANVQFKADCKIYQKLKSETAYVESKCEGSDNCHGLCTSDFTVINLKVGTEYSFKIVPSWLYTKTQDIIKDVVTSAKFTSVTVQTDWQENSLIVTTMLTGNVNTICDFKFVEKNDNDKIIHIFAVYDQTTGWKAPCNKKITFLHASHLKTSTMIVKPRYIGNPVEVSIAVSDTKDKSGQNNDKTGTNTATTEKDAKKISS